MYGLTLVLRDIAEDKIDGRPRTEDSEQRRREIDPEGRRRLDPVARFEQAFAPPNAPPHTHSAARGAYPLLAATGAYSLLTTVR